MAKRDMKISDLFLGFVGLILLLNAGEKGMNALLIIMVFLISYKIYVDYVSRKKTKKK